MKKSKIFLCFILSMTLCCCTEISSEIPPSFKMLTTAINETEAQTEVSNITETAFNKISETDIQEDTVTEAVLCDELESVLQNGGYTAEDISDTKQLITVVSDGTYCTLSLFELNNNTWETIYYTSGIVGKDGVSENSSEYNSHTPKGIFPLGFAFGTEQLYDLSIEYRLINENCYWIDDGESELYNQWVESEVITWNSAEHLIDYPSEYKYAVVIESNNNPIVPYGGSAIFLHCNNFRYDYTAGCVAIPEEDMYNILTMLDENDNPMILIY